MNVRKVVGRSLGGLLALVAVLVLLIATGVVGPPKVPPEAIATAVDRTPDRLARARALPAAATYEQALHFQANPSLCGPASLVNVRRSLGLPAAGESTVLEGSGKCWSGVCFMGLTLDELAEIAGRSSDLRVTVLRDLSPEAFREHLRRSNDPGARYVVNFARKPIFGGGTGHHSPIAGYLEDEDLVLVLDVNRDFGPWLVERERLFAAMDTLDGSSGRKRGLLRLERSGG